MLARWTEAGFCPSLFWRQTPRSYAAALSGYARRLRIQEQLAVSQAWHTAFYSRSKKLPQLHETLKRLEARHKPKRVTPQTPDEMLAALRAWVTVTGGDQASPAEQPNT